MTITEQMKSSHPMFSTKSKDECIEYIRCNKDRLTYTKADSFTDEEVKRLQAVFSSGTAEGIYVFIGDFLSVKESDFANIHYREECFEYLTNIGIEPEVAILMSEEIRKGIWSMRDSEYKKYVPIEFLEWAEKVKYLVSRKVIFEDFIDEE